MQKEFYEILINSSVDGILAFDRECRYILWNPAMERISGMKAVEVLGRCAFDIFPFLKDTGEDQFFLEALQGKSNITHNRPYSVRRTGREGFYEGHYSPLYDAEREIVGGFAIIREVTEQKRAEEALRESEKRYRDLVENSLGLMSTHDMNGVLLSVNRAAARMLGYQPEEMVGKNFIEFIAPSMRPRVPLYLAQLKYERAGHGLMRLVTRAGEERTWIYRNTRYDETGKASYVIGHAQDITERVRAEEALRSAHDELELRVTERTAELREANRILKEQIAERERIEEALRESEARFRSLFENATIGLYRTMPDGRILLANPTLIRMLGYSTFEEIARRNLETEGFEPDYSRKLFRALLERADLIIGLESSWTKLDGSVISVRESARTIRDATGEVLYYEGTVEDITERKLAEEALRRSEINLRLLVETTNAVPWQADTSTWLFTYVGPQAEKLLGYPVPDWYGKDFWTEHIHPDDRARAVEACLMGSESCRNFELEYRMLAASGESIWVHDIVNCECVDGHTAQLRGFMIDITERKQTEEALRRLADRLTTAQEDEHRRISRSLHDEAGQALTALSVRLHRLEKRFAEQNGNDGSVCAELAELRQIAQSTQEGLRNMAHTLHPSVLEHFGLIEAVRGFLNDAGADSEVELLSDVARSFPRFSPTEESTIYRIIQEAVTNALRHSGTKRIRVSFDGTNAAALISIEDAGGGFDPQSTEAMNGIGLVSMRERAEMIGGQLLISSDEGKGTRVTLSIPVSAEA
ncbi:MAG TPA: PAS domain S-box protein [Pyrinomonadaceae bacterium]